MRSSALLPVLVVGCLVGMGGPTVGLLKADEPSAKAQATQKMLKTKISVEFKNTRLEEVVEELKEQVKGLKIQVDSKGGVSRNSTLSFQAKETSLEEILDKMLEKNGLGYQIISNKGNAYDGLLKIVQGKDRGKLVK